MGVKRWRKKAEDRFAWTIILKEGLVKLQVSYANKQEEEDDYLLRTRKLELY
jgi:hypothetical protein